jgi:DNA-binding transcriptional ArsR family regulator
MKEGPDIARIAALIGDPARANILTALMDGRALTASELAEEAGVTLPTTSGHLAKLSDAELLQHRKQGRHKYFQLADGDVAAALESLMSLAANRSTTRVRTGPRDDALRTARVCYNHLAGRLGVQLFQSMAAQGYLMEQGETVTLTESGARFVTDFGVNLSVLQSKRTVLCRSCLDWSERRTHLAGSLGRSMLTQMEDRKWMRRDPKSRAVVVSPKGQAAFAAAFPI